MRPAAVHREPVALAAAWWALSQAAAHLGPVALASVTLDISPVLVAAWGEPTWPAAAFPELVVQVERAASLAPAGMLASGASSELAAPWVQVAVPVAEHEDLAPMCPLTEATWSEPGR